VIHAVKEVGLKVPLVVRLEGTNVKEGRQLLASSGLAVVSATDMAMRQEDRRAGGRCLVSVLVGKQTRLIVQGLTGSAGSFHAKQMSSTGTQVVGGVTPARAAPGTRHPGVRHLRGRGQADPLQRDRHLRAPPGAATPSWKAAAGGIALIVCITEGIPVRDMMKAKQYLKGFPGSRRHRPQLSRHHHAGRVQDRHHAGLHPQPGKVGLCRARAR